MRHAYLFVAAFLALQPSLAEDIEITDAALVGAYSAKNYNRTSIHDPSIFMDTVTSKTTTNYYVMGSHLGFARTPNLNNGQWTTVGGNGEWNSTLFAKPDGTACNYTDAYAVPAVQRVKNYAGEEVDMVQFDAHAWQNSGFNVQGNQWAPDVIYNPTMKKWLMYMSLNGDKWCSSIVCFAADRPLGRYIYQGVVVCSGFNGKTAHNGFAAADDWKKTDLAIATGCTSLPARYAPSGNYGNYWPNCIDPCVFYDEEGKLWLSYGSWSGGIFMLELDETTGLRDYTVQYPYQVNGTTVTPASANQNCTCDPYFGKKIAGGWYVSGEGSYIEHIGDYYYLFISYGGFAPDGGYEMRMFRSENPDGPYKDCYGTSALQTGKYEMNYGTNASTNRGMKLMGGYKWDLMGNAEVSQGHNSAFTDKEGRSFVVYHTKFNDGTAGHQVRIHQLLMNSDKWPVAMPYEFHGETIKQAQVESSENISDEEIPGDYQFLIHKYNQDYQNMAYQKPVNIKLVASANDPKSGTIAGNYNGGWKRIEGTDFVEITISGVVYKGVLTKQTVDYSNISAICISAVSSSSGSISLGQNNFTYQRQIWASKANYKGAILYTKQKTTVPFKSGDNVTENVTLPTTGYLGAKVSWTTSDSKVMTVAGVVRGNGLCTMTLNIAKDGYVWRKSYDLIVGDPSGIETLSPEETPAVPAYDLQGRQLRESQKGGIRVVGGKKVIISNR